MYKSEKVLKTKDVRNILCLTDIYNPQWEVQVSRMKPNQVWAIYSKFKSEGRIYFDGSGNMYFRSKEEVKKLKERRKKEKEKLNGHQIMFDEFFGDLIMEKEKTNGKN